MVSFLSHNICGCCRRPDLEQRFDYNRRQSDNDGKKNFNKILPHQASIPNLLDSMFLAAQHYTLQAAANNKDQGFSFFAIALASRMF
jgi:hypothetical protein